jgi:hypothetical protein
MEDQKMIDNAVVQSRYPQVDAYFRKYMTPALRRRPNYTDKAEFIETQLENWERIEERLHAWTLVGDGSPNPYSPPLDPERVRSIIAELSDFAAVTNETSHRVIVAV